VKGNEHSAYLQQIVKALIEKRGMSPDKAYGVARAAIRKWGSGRGKVRPEVRAAAAAAEGQEISAQARAHMHSNVELAQPQKQQQKKGGGRPQSSNWQGEARVPAGGPTGGQFGSGSSGGQKAKGKPPVSQHGPLAQRRAALLQQAQADREKAHQLMAQLKALTAHHRTTGKSASSAPKAKGAGAQSAKQAKQGQAKTGTKKSAGKTGTATGSAMSTAMKISNLKAEIVRLLLQARKLTHQAHSL
jgi:hypothetical protein